MICNDSKENNLSLNDCRAEPEKGHSNDIVSY